jgi:hypothetical protein
MQIAATDNRPSASHVPAHHTRPNMNATKRSYRQRLQLGAEEVERRNEGRRWFVPTSRRAAETSALLRPHDAEFLHFGLERRTLHAQFGGGTGSAADGPLGLTEGLEDVLSLRILEGFQ